MPRRTLTIVVAAILLTPAGCGTGDAATPGVPSTVGDVGVLPGTLPGESTAPTSEAPRTSDPESTSAGAAPTSRGPTTTVGSGAASMIGRRVEGNRVLVIGDSILASISNRYGDQLCDELVPKGWVVEVDAEVGRSIGFGRQVLERRPPDEWDAAIVMLGNNYDGDPQAFGRELSVLLDELEPLPVVLLDVTRFEPQQDEVNWIVTGEAHQRDDVVLVDWAGPTADATPGSARLLAGDGLHLSTAGQEALAALIARAMGRAPQGSRGSCLRSSFRDDSMGTIPDDRNGGTDGTVTTSR